MDLRGRGKQRLDTERVLNNSWALRSFILFIVDIALTIFAGLAALELRFEFHIPVGYLYLYIENIIITTSIMVIAYWIFNLYTSLWRYASIGELISVVASCFVGSITLYTFNVLRRVLFPRSFYIMFMIICMMGIGGVRFVYRALRRAKVYYVKSDKSYKRVLVIGAGKAGAMVIKEMLTSEHVKIKPVAIIDDDKSKQHRKINDVPIVGTRKDIAKAVKQYDIDQILIAIPTLTRKDMKSILDICKETDTKLKTLPGMYELINGSVDVKKVRDVSVEDLLGRDPINMDINGIKTYIEHKVVLVTGGGGSIGSELCRQICQFAPSRLIVFDIYENNAYQIQNELKKLYPELNIKVLIGSVRDTKRLEYIFGKYRPSIVFHAAAHKHVPLMEDSPSEAIKNNVFGTYNVASLADKYGIDRFILISTDKAVNPTNIMGATKRICEMIIQSLNNDSQTVFNAVRFGNVLGSNGSVIPLFKKQIEEGGPITVTDKRIIRYFMTIPEAVQLIIQSGTIASGGEIFVLDMGDPVKIDDLAKDLIKLSGLKLGVDIDIEYVGLRPGEKLYEELLMEEEGITSTRLDKIHIGKPLDIDRKMLGETLNELDRMVQNDNYEGLLELVKGIVPGYSYVEVG